MPIPLAWGLSYEIQPDLSSIFFNFFPRRFFTISTFLPDPLLCRCGLRQGITARTVFALRRLALLRNNLAINLLYD